MGFRLLVLRLSWYDNFRMFNLSLGLLICICILLKLLNRLLVGILSMFSFWITLLNVVVGVQILEVSVFWHKGCATMRFDVVVGALSLD